MRNFYNYNTIGLRSSLCLLEVFITSSISSLESPPGGFFKISRRKSEQVSFKLTREVILLISTLKHRDKQSSVLLWKSYIVFYAKLESNKSERIKCKVFLIPGFALQYWTSTKSLQVLPCSQSLPSPFTGSLQSPSNPVLAS